MTEQIDELEAIKLSMTKPAEADSSLNKEGKSKEEEDEEGTPPPPPEPDEDDQHFTQYLQKKGSKFTKFDEIDNLVKEHELTKKERDELKAVPKEDLDDEVRRIIDLKKSGVKFNKEYFELLNKDYDALNKENPMNTLVEAMLLQDENKGISRKALEFKLRKKYELDKYNDVEAEDLTETQKEELEIAKELFTHDAGLALNNLKKNQADKTVFAKPTQAQIDEHNTTIANNKKAWQEKFDSIHKDTTSFKVPYKNGDKDEVFEFIISDSDRKDVTDDFKNDNWLKEFVTKDEKGNVQYNDKAIYEMRLQNKLFAKAINKAIEDGMAVGAKKEFDGLKNTNFKPKDSKATELGKPKTEAEAIERAIKKKLNQ